MSPEAPVTFPFEEKVPTNATREKLIEEIMENDVLYQLEEVDFDGDREHCRGYRVATLTPPTPDHNNTIFYAGFSTRGGNKIDFLSELSREMNTKITFWDHLHGIELGDDVRYPGEEDIPKTQLEKIVALDHAFADYNVPSADIVGHSEGCIHAVTTAYQNPEQFETITLINPAGLIPMKMIDLGLQGVQEGVFRKKAGTGEHKNISQSVRVIREQLKHGAMLFESVRGISKVSEDGVMYEMIKELRKKGITVNMIYTEHDKLFLPDAYEHIAALHHEDGLLGLFSSVTKLPGDHSSLLTAEHAPLIQDSISINVEETHLAA